MANTYVLIASATAGSGGSSSFDFTSIPQTYTDLLVKVTYRGDANVTLYLNGATYGSAAAIQLYGNGTTAGSNTRSNGFLSDAQYNSTLANTFGSLEAYISNYTSSGNKQISSFSATEANATTAYLEATAINQNVSAAITSLSITPSANTFAQYSSAYLYGIKNS